LRAAAARQVIALPYSLIPAASLSRKAARMRVMCASTSSSVSMRPALQSVSEKARLRWSGGSGLPS
jgi:hypothetical protein